MSAGGHPATRKVPWHEDFYFGPPSEPVDIATFLSEAAAASSALSALVEEVDEEHTGEAEGVDVGRNSYDISDLRTELHNILDIPKLSHFLRRSADDAAKHVFRTNDQPEGGSGSGPSVVRRPTPIDHLFFDDTDVDIARVKEHLENRPLRISRLPKQADLFIRKPRQLDQNSLTAVQAHGSTSSDNDAEHEPVAVLSISVYSIKPSWPRSVHISSKHEFLSSHTLADLLRHLHCQTYDLVPVDSRRGPVDILQSAFVGMERVVYGPNGEDAGKKMAYLTSDASRGPVLSQASLSIEEARFDAIPLRMRYPYWVFHRGTCEHVWIVDGIQLHHRTDPPIHSYPLTTFLPPSLSPNCRVCQTLPADIAVSGDIRLGESPSLVCKTCWDLLGWPRGGVQIQAFWLRGSYRNAP